MNHKRTSLLRSMFKSLLLPGIVVAIVGVLIVYLLVKEEYDELQDLSLLGKAHLILNATPPSPQPEGTADLLAYETSIMEADERTIFWILDAQARLLVASGSAAGKSPPAPRPDGFFTAQGYRLAVLTAADGSGRRIIVAIPMGERNEAITDILTGVLLGFALLALIFATAARWAVQRSVRTITNLSANIARKGEHDLSPIDRRNSFAEIEPAIDTLDTLMLRLDSALEAERAFATNAAHELRTPLAISLAHVQRLKSQLADPNHTAHASEIEAGLKRLVRLIERLLQMSRAQAGLGVTEAASDINPVITLLLRELRDREPDADKLVIYPPSGNWICQVDCDALGIILNNLFENALKYASGPQPTIVDARTPGRVVVSNDCAPLSASELDTIRQRFVRKSKTSEGFGLGLSIAQQLSEQSGCTLDITSPQRGATRGFSAVLSLPDVRE